MKIGGDYPSNSAIRSANLLISMVPPPRYFKGPEAAVASHSKAKEPGAQRPQQSRPSLTNHLRFSKNASRPKKRPAPRVQLKFPNKNLLAWWIKSR